LGQAEIQLLLGTQDKNKVTAEFADEDELANYSSQRMNHEDLVNNFKMANSLLSGPSTVGKISQNVSPIKNENDESILSFFKVSQPTKKQLVVPKLDMRKVFEVQKMQIRAAEE